MRHRVYGKHLSRDKNQREALYKSLVGALFLNGSIETTQTKAKAVKGVVDKIITQAKSPSTQRLISSFLINKQVQEKLVKEIAPALKDRNSGYTSIVKLGVRPGDGAMVVRMSLLGDIKKGLPEKKITGNKNQETSKKEEKLEIKNASISEEKGGTGRSVRKTKSVTKGTTRSSK